MEPSCAGVILHSGTSCSLLTYSSDLSSSLAAKDLQSSYYYHKSKTEKLYIQLYMYTQKINIQLYMYTQKITIELYMYTQK